MKHLYKALATFQQSVPVIHKGSEGYGYSYADLTAIFKAINPLMKKHGLGFTQTVSGTQLCTTVFHVESGETLESCADIPQGVTLAKMNDFQVLGSAITYMRRYQLSAMLGLVTDKDTDATGEQVNKAKPELKKADIEAAVKWAVENGKSVQDCKKYYAMTPEIEALLKENIVSIQQLS